MKKKLKVLLFNFNNILTDVQDGLIQRGHQIVPHYGPNLKLSDWRQADVIIVWQETDLGQWRDWIKEVQKEGKKVILVQHGRRGTSRIFPPFNEKLVSDIVCVWGENDVERLTSCGVSREKIKVTGTTIFKHLKPRVPHDGHNIIFSPEHWDYDVSENAVVMGWLNRIKIKGIKVISKLLEGEHNPHHYLNPVVSNRNKPEHLSICADVLSLADAVVAISESTFELLAQSLDIPVIIADIWQPKSCAGDDRYKEYQREYSPACTKVKTQKELENTLLRQLDYPVLSQERKEIVIKDGGRNIEDPLSEIIKVIENEGNRR
ncbi:hypothetical protein GW915_00645 [bacterium]|nr:hypothetical protein [bacterium]